MKTLSLSVDSANEVGIRLREIRKEKGLTLEELGDRLGVSAQTVGELERGESGLSLSRLARVLEALEVKGELFFGDGEEQPIQSGPTLERIRLAGEIVGLITSVDEGVIRDIYLYGSTAHGSASPDSDLDLLLVLDTDRIETHRWAIEFYTAIHDIQFQSGIYVSLQTRSYENWSEETSSFKKEVTERGFRIYHRPGGCARALEASA